MTSSLPGSATEALLFQPLGRHDAMRSLKVKERVAFAATGLSWPLAGGAQTESAPWEYRSASLGARPGSSLQPRAPPSHFGEHRQTGCSRGS